MTEAVAPLSNGVQVGMRIPVVLVALAGVVLILILMRRLGARAAVLGALGSLIIAVDQLVNIAWVLHVASISKNPDFDIDRLTSVNNRYTIADSIIITIGAALVVIAIVLRRPAAQPATFPAQPGFGTQPGYQGQAGFPGQAGYPPQPAYQGQPAYPAVSGQPAYPVQQPAVPGQPAQYDQPAQPAQSGQSGQPGQPGQYAQSGQYAQPGQYTPPVQPQPNFPQPEQPQPSYPQQPGPLPPR